MIVLQENISVCVCVGGGGGGGGGIIVWTFKFDRPTQCQP